MQNMTESQAIPEHLKPLVTWATEIPWGAVSFFAILFYGLLRFSYSLFYSRFGVTPEEVGIGYGQLLSQSAIGVSITFVITLMLVLGEALAVKAAMHETQGYLSRFSSEFDQVRNHFAWTLLFLAYRPVFIGGLVLLATNPKGLAPTLGNALFFLGICSFFAVRIHLQSVSAPQVEIKPSAPLIKKRTFVFLTLATIVAVLFGILPFWARQDAIEVEGGRKVKTDWPVDLWRGDPAAVYWLGDPHSCPPAVTPQRKLMYLGEANGVAVLYDVEQRRTLRVPSGQIAIQTMR